MNTSVEFINVRRQFGDVTAVNDVSIKINEGEFSLCSDHLVRGKLLAFDSSQALSKQQRTHFNSRSRRDQTATLPARCEYRLSRLCIISAHEYS